MEEYVNKLIGKLKEKNQLTRGDIKKLLKISYEDVDAIVEVITSRGLAIKEKTPNSYRVKLIELGERTPKIDQSREKDKMDYVIKLEETNNEMLKELMSEIRYIKEYLKITQNPVNFPNMEKIFDEYYNKVKNALGVANLKLIREQMGVTKEEFYSKLSNYVQANYELIPGGEEGILVNGTICGIIRRR
ncbi:hypothetical protein HS7_10360 [Sulfolobales archaeon HS-7]|nr:hypothetical protein HS7_10360 [Sulfolobales archaeon HS-7]